MLKALFDWVNVRAPLDSPSSHNRHASTAKYVTDVSQKAVAHVYHFRTDRESMRWPG